MSKRNLVVATDSRVREGEVLFLVDRHKRRDIWWSNDLKDSLVLTRGEAEARVKTIRHNNPRIMDLETARRHTRETDPS